MPQATTTSHSPVCSSFVQTLHSVLLLFAAPCTELQVLSSLLYPQAALLNSFPAIFDELLQMFTVQEVAEFVRGTLGSMPSTVHIGQSMDVVKLQSIARTVDSRLFSFSGEPGLSLLPHLGCVCSGFVGNNSLLNASNVGNYFPWQHR